MTETAKKTLCTALAFFTIIGSVTGTAGAVQAEREFPVIYTMDTARSRASGLFNMTISASSKGVADSSFPLEAGETVRINASYSPDVSVDFGLVGDDGVFHYFNVTGGNIDKTIRISERGNYTLQVRNNSAKSVKVSGFVQY